MVNWMAEKGFRKRATLTGLAMDYIFTKFGFKEEVDLSVVREVVKKENFPKPLHYSFT